MEGFLNEIRVSQDECRHDKCHHVGSGNFELEIPKNIQARTSRSAPCPCGSGKKYKRCCGPRDEEVYRKSLAKLKRLDDWSNGVMDAIEAERHDEAERLCEDLLKHYPDQIDGHERLASVREAQGRWEEAVAAYDRSLAHIDRYPAGFDQGSIDSIRERRERAREKAACV